MDDEASFVSLIADDDPELVGKSEKFDRSTLPKLSHFCKIAAEPPPPRFPGLPRARLICYSVSKRANVGVLCRTAVAFGFEEIVVVGMKKVTFHGSHRTASHIAFRHFDSLEVCVQQMHSEGFSVVGCEIGDRAESLLSFDFLSLVPPSSVISVSSTSTITPGNVCFMMGNEALGLSQKAMDLCDRIVYIPQVTRFNIMTCFSLDLLQYTQGTASLNVAAAFSILAHTFVVQAKYPQSPMYGAKFITAEQAAEEEAENE